MLIIKKEDYKALNKIYPLIDADFDKRELLSKVTVLKGMIKGEMELYIAYDDESDIMLAYALTMSKSVYKYVLLKYFAVFPWYREKGIGTGVMRLLNEKYADRQGIIAEIPVFEDNDEEQIKRLTKFFNRFGYSEIKSDYKIGSAETKVLVKNIKNDKDISPIYHRILRDFYSRCLPNGSKIIEINAVK